MLNDKIIEMQKSLDNEVNSKSKIITENDQLKQKIEYLQTHLETQKQKKNDAKGKTNIFKNKYNLKKQQVKDVKKNLESYKNTKINNPVKLLAHMKNKLDKTLINKNK